MRPHPPIRKKSRKTLFQIFLIPTALFILGSFGLVVALLENGWVDIVAVLALCTSLLAIIWSWVFKRKKR